MIFPHLARLYRLVAADCPGVVSRWMRMQSNYGTGGGFKTGLQLYLFRLLRIRRGSFLFRCFRLLNQWRMAR